MSKDQHGFVPGRSTYTAIKDALNWMDNRSEKYVIGTFLDITGAFDNL